MVDIFEEKKPNINNFFIFFIIFFLNYRPISI